MRLPLTISVTLDLGDLLEPLEDQTESPSGASEPENDEEKCCERDEPARTTAAPNRETNGHLPAGTHGVPLKQRLEKMTVGDAASEALDLPPAAIHRFLNRFGRDGLRSLVHLIEEKVSAAA